MTTHSTQPTERDPSAHPGSTPHADVTSRLRRLWEAAGAIHQAAVNDTATAPEIRFRSLDLIVELFDLSDALLVTGASGPVPSASRAGTGEEVVAHG